MGDKKGKTGKTASSLKLRRRDLLMGGSALLATAAMSGAARAATARPNILYILVDDLGWKDVGYHGSDIKTPNIDKLAETGAKLEEFYVQPMCTPSRAALMTGRYPFRYGLQTGVIPSAGKYGMALDEYTLPQSLKDAGYTTSIVGKWHLGHADKKQWPSQRGFDKSYGPLIGEIDHFKHESHGVKDWYKDNKPLVEKGYDTELFGAEAIRQINADDGKAPFFMYLAFTAPHTPYQAPQRYLDMYKNITDPQRQAYAAQITAMDDQVGAVVAALNKKGIRDNTLIIFSSDNGGTRDKMFAGEAAVAGELPPSNGPYRAGKGTVYEGGCRVAAIANWPGRIQPSTLNEMMHITDIYPTVAGLAGAKLDKAKPLDGMDVWQVFAAGKPSPRDEIVYNLEPYRAGIRKGNMKLVWHSILPSNVELFDLDKDPSEATNIAAQNPDKVKELQDRLEALSKEAKPPLFMMEMLKIGLSQKPAFADAGLDLGAED
jgi:arylsulfatase I/J